MELGLDHFPAGFVCQGGLNKDLTVWLDGAIPPQMYAASIN